VFLLLAAGSASALELYGIDDTSLYTVDPATGVATLIGPLDPPVPGLLGGLEWANGVLYGLAGTPGNALWWVDPATAECTLVGPLNAGGVFEGGLAWDGQDMWGVNVGVFNQPKGLVKIDLETGAGTFVGTIGDIDFNGLAMHNGQLYGINSRVGSVPNNALWLIDRTNPSASYQIGSGFGFTLGVKGGLAGEYGYADGPYPPGDGPYQFFRVDFDTGSAEVLATTTVRFRSLAPIPVETCVGDVDGDGDTDHSDLGILLADWGCVGSEPEDCSGDLDGDFDTDHSDLGILLADWGCVP